MQLRRVCRPDRERQLEALLLVLRAAALDPGRDDPSLTPPATCKASHLNDDRAGSLRKEAQS